MTVEECLAGVTREAARALGLSGETGTLEAGKWADLAIWDVESPAELVYRMGFNPLHSRVWRGQMTTTRSETGRRHARRLARHLSRRRAGARPGLPAEIAASAARRRAHRRQGRAGLRHQHRLRKARQRAHSGFRPRNPAAQHRAQPCGRRRRADAGCDRAADDGAEARQPGAGRIRRAAGNGRAARSHAGKRRDPCGAGAGLGRRFGRPRAAGAHDGGDDRRRRMLYAAWPRAARRSPSSRTAWSRSCLAPRKAWRCSTARSFRPPMHWRRCSRPRCFISRRWSPGRCRPTRQEAPTRPSIPRIHRLRKHQRPDRDGGTHCAT